jgi:hypothetical protein
VDRGKRTFRGEKMLEEENGTYISRPIYSFISGLFYSI